MKYLLDTNICVFFLRGKLNLDEIIKEKGRENCFISEIIPPLAIPARLLFPQEFINPPLPKINFNLSSITN